MKERISIGFEAMCYCGDTEFVSGTTGKRDALNWFRERGWRFRADGTPLCSECLWNASCDPEHPDYFLAWDGNPPADDEAEVK